jgi:endonuclease/exonuclease/phosphatase family metal-dependent hydrolase
MSPRILSPLFVLALCAVPAAAEELRVMSYNVWGGGANEEKGIDETLAVLRAANPDIVGIQETRTEGEVCEADYCPPGGTSVAAALAEAMGFYHYDQTAENVALWANAIISRYPIGPATPNDLCVPIEAPGRTVWACNVHLDDEPYQPYQLLGIEYGPAPFINTAEDAIRFAEETRGPAIELLIADMAATTEGDITFVFGDFNEPSGHDWTEAAAEAGLHPIAVNWPTTRALEQLGFTDAYRAVHPDPVAKPAFTWTPWGDEADPEDHHDRIDFVLVRGDVTVTDAAIVGEAGPRSDLAVDPWPSDHRAVLAVIAYD